LILQLVSRRDGEKGAAVSSSWSQAGRRPNRRLLSEALRPQLGQLKTDDPNGRSYAEAIAGSLIAIACSQDPSGVTAAEIANRIEGRSMQRLEVNHITADRANRSDDQLRYHLLHDAWPEDANGTEEDQP
jgi:hypothetical protein